MQNLKGWLFAVLVVAAISGAAVIVESGTLRTVSAQDVPAGDYWRNHDGRWSLWHQADRRWYYTDGLHWFFNDGKSWRLYKFDKEFGRTSFVRGDYRPPAEDVKVTHPNHKVYGVP